MQEIAREAEIQAMHTNGQDHRLLAIDDDPKILRIYEKLLAPRGFSVTTCSAGADVVPLLKTHDYDVALVDIRLPGLDGTDLLPLMKKLCPELPIIIVSGYCEEGHAEYYHALGACEVIRKPFQHEVLTEAIARALAHQDRIPVILSSLSLRAARDQVYRKLILAALHKANWNQVKAAELLGVSRYCLIRWLKKLGISY